MERKCRSAVVFTIVLLVFFQPAESCSVKVPNKIDHGLADLGRSFEKSSGHISNALKAASGDIKSSIESAVSGLEKISGKLEGSLDRNAQLLSKTVTSATADLVKIGDRLGDSIDNGVDELGSVMREALNATKEISQMLTNSVDKGVEMVGKEIQNAIHTVKSIVEGLTNSIDKGVAELGNTLRYVADSIVEISKQVSMRVDSGDLVQMANVTKEGLVQSMEVLTRNWEVAVNTADLKDVGQGAASELRKALNDINVKVTVGVTIDVNTRDAVLYISIAVGVGFSVCFVAIVVSLKGCRNCAKQVFNRSRCTVPGRLEGGEEDVAEMGLKREVKKSSTVNTKSSIPKRTTPKKKVEQDDWSSTEDSDDDDATASLKFDKRNTGSLRDYDISKAKRKWEKREKRALQKKTFLPD